MDIDVIIAEAGILEHVEGAGPEDFTRLAILVKNLAQIVRSHVNSSNKHVTFIGTDGPSFGEQVAK